MNIQYYTAEAFTRRPYHGAQIAVFPDARKLEGWQMQKLANELNLSETVFVTERQDTHYQLRVFTPYQEVSFAGHPLIAAGHVLATIGLIDLSDDEKEVTFQLSSGPVLLNVQGCPKRPERISFRLATSASCDHMTPPKSEIAEALSLETNQIGIHLLAPMIIRHGLSYLIVPVKNFETVRAARFNQRSWVHSNASDMMISEVLLFSPGAADPSHDFHARLLGPDIGAKEDPPIGSAVPAFANYLAQQLPTSEIPTNFTIERGTADTRQSVLHIEAFPHETHTLELRVGGPSVSVSHGAILIPAREEIYA